MITTRKRFVEVEDYVVCCDKCGTQAGPIFAKKYEAQDWLNQDPLHIDDPDAYLDLNEGLIPPPVEDLFHRVGGKLYCPKCVDVLIQETKRAA